MQLVYYHKHVPNFGDDLNTMLWSGLVPDLFERDPDIGFVGIGTIIGMPCGDIPRLNVFSSGVGNDRPELWRDKQVAYWCVRGPISTRILDLPADRAITDGAVLTPLVAGFPKAATGTGGTLIVPHFQTLDHPGWPEVAAQTGYELLDPRDDPRSVIARIAAAKLVLTESLHGAILADTYGVPWHAFATSKNFGITKWVDWTLSVGRKFHLTMVPPPDAGPIIAFGRAPAPFGQTVHYDAEAAMAQFDVRVTVEPETLRTRLKGIVKASPLFRRFLGFSPARTADALRQLARAEPMVSPPSLVQDLQQRMQDRLAALAAAPRQVVTA